MLRPYDNGEWLPRSGGGVVVFAACVALSLSMPIPSKRRVERTFLAIWMPA